MTESVTGVLMKKMDEIKIKIESQLNGLKVYLKNNYQIAGAALALVIFCAIYFSQGSDEPKKFAESPDTFIPAGFVLVPIDVVNKDALQSMLGNFGVVDLYIPATEPGKLGKKAASRVKILRAPLNPEEFAVLVREGEAFQLVHHDSGFFIVIQNPNQRGTKIVKPISRRNRISYEGG
jgi:hypothetical protein